MTLTWPNHSNWKSIEEKVSYLDSTIPIRVCFAVRPTTYIQDLYPTCGSAEGGSGAVAVQVQSGDDKASAHVTGYLLPTNERLRCGHSHLSSLAGPIVEVLPAGSACLSARQDDSTLSLSEVLPTRLWQD